GTPYFFQVAAINAIGIGSYSAPSAGVTPATVPGAPTGVTGSAGDRPSTGTWAAPARTGRSATTRDPGPGPPRVPAPVRQCPGPVQPRRRRSDELDAHVVTRRRPDLRDALLLPGGGDQHDRHGQLLRAVRRRDAGHSAGGADGCHRIGGQRASHGDMDGPVQ